MRVVIMTMAIGRSIADPANLKPGCPLESSHVYADMHDGNQRQVSINRTSLMIKPHGNNQTWVIYSRFNLETCSASVDFNVPGKDGPPVNLTVAFGYTRSFLAPNGFYQKTLLEFHDPSGTLASKDLPLNQWVQVDPGEMSSLGHTEHDCSDSRLQDIILADMHDGDQKEVLLRDASITIKPYGNDQSWVVNSVLDRTTCSAVVNFNVPGKPEPPPVELKATVNFVNSKSHPGLMMNLEFTDPSGTLAPAGIPLNRWVEISRETGETTLLASGSYERNLSTGKVVGGLAKRAGLTLLAHYSSSQNGERLHNDDGESGFSKACKQIGFAVIVCLVVVGGLALYKGAWTKAQCMYVLQGAGLWQASVLLLALGTYIVSGFVQVPGYVCVFILGSVWNVAEHMKA